LDYSENFVAESLRPVKTRETRQDPCADTAAKRTMHFATWLFSLEVIRELLYTPPQSVEWRFPEWPQLSHAGFCFR